MRKTNKDLLGLLLNWTKKISSLNVNQKDLLEFKFQAESLIESLKEEIEFHEFFASESTLVRFGMVENRLKILLIGVQKQIQNKAETTKFLASNNKLTPELERILHALLNPSTIGYKNQILERRREIQLKISYILILSFGLKELDLKTIRLSDIQLLINHQNIQLNKRNLRLNNVSIGYLKSVVGIDEFLLFSQLNEQLWDLSMRKLVDLLNKNIEFLLAKEHLAALRCHELRRKVLINLLDNPVYMFVTNQELSELFGMTGTYLSKFREKSTL